MKVKFDLRPAEYIKRERKTRSFNLVRLLAILLMLGFIVTSAGYIAMAFIESQNLASDIEMLESEVRNLEDNQRLLMTEISRLKQQETQMARSLAIMRNEPPTLEAMNVLDTYMEPGMGFTRVTFTPAAASRNSKQSKPDELVQYTMTIDGSSASDEQNTELLNRLNSNPNFTSVTMPTSTRDQATKRVNFNLVLGLKSFGEFAIPSGEGGSL